jgi:hypothetical protein
MTPIREREEKISSEIEKSEKTILKQNVSIIINTMIFVYEVIKSSLKITFDSILMLLDQFNQIIT